MKLFLFTLNLHTQREIVKEPKYYAIRSRLNFKILLVFYGSNQKFNLYKNHFSGKGLLKLDFITYFLENFLSLVRKFKTKKQ